MITEVKLFFLILYLVLIVPNIRVSHDLQGNDTIIIIIQSWQSVMIRLDHALITHSVFKSGNLDIFRFYIFLSCWWWGVGWCCDGYDDGVFRWLLEDTGVSGADHGAQVSDSWYWPCYHATDSDHHHHRLQHPPPHHPQHSDRLAALLHCYSGWFTHDSSIFVSNINAKVMIRHR